MEYLGKKARRLPPRGIDGGEGGRIRGRISEEKVFLALEWLKSQKRIFDFSQTPKGTPGKDFIVRVEKKSRKIVSLPLEVKSSYRRKGIHVKKKNEAPVVVVRDRDELFGIAQQIKTILGLS